LPRRFRRRERIHQSGADAPAFRRHQIGMRFCQKIITDDYDLAIRPDQNQITALLRKLRAGREFAARQQNAAWRLRIYDDCRVISVSFVGECSAGSFQRRRRHRRVGGNFIRFFRYPHALDFLSSHVIPQILRHNFPHQAYNRIDHKLKVLA
jgi:hypothetical protein